MKFAVCLSILFAVACAQFYPPRGYFPGPYYPFPYRPVGYPGSEEYAASLGGAKVGLYGKSHGPYGYGYPYGYPGAYGGKPFEVTGASLGGAKVGLYGKERPGGRPY